MQPPIDVGKEGVFRVDPYRFGIVGDGFVVFAHSLVDVPPVVVGFGEFRFEPDHLGKVGDGFVVLTYLGVGVCPVVVGGSEFRVDSNRFGIVGNGLVVLTHLVIGEPPVVVGEGVFRFEPNRFSVGEYTRLRLAQGAMGKSGSWQRLGPWHVAGFDLQARGYRFESGPHHVDVQGKEYHRGFGAYFIGMEEIAMPVADRRAATILRVGKVRGAQKVSPCRRHRPA